MKVERLLQELAKVNNKGKWENKDIFRLLYFPDLYELAFKEIKGNKGSRTAGVDGENKESYNTTMVENIVSLMRQNKYEFKPARRTYIKKANGKMRPLGIPTFRDRIVEKAMLLILECIYLPEKEPKHSYGFIKGRSCPQIAAELRFDVEKFKYVIEGDLSAAFDNVTHASIESRLRLKIKDERFINLVRRRLKAGYTEKGILHKTNIGTPQGGILSPFLFNRAMEYLDEGFVYLMDTMNRGKTHAYNQKFAIELFHLRSEYKKAQNTDVKESLRQAVKDIIAKKRLSHPKTPNPKGRGLKAYRYADDWIVMFNGPKWEMDNILKVITEKCKLTGVTLNDEKTVITESRSGFNFLGYYFRNNYSLSRVYTRKTKEGVKFSQKRANLGCVGIDQRILKRLTDRRFCTKDGFPRELPELIHSDDEAIIQFYARIWIGILNYFKVCDQGCRLIGQVYYILQWSCIKSLAHKHKSSTAKVIKKYGKHPSAGKSSFPKAKSSDLLGWKWKSNQMCVRELHTVLNTTSFVPTRKSRADKCIKCGCTDQTKLESHHVHSLKGKKYNPGSFDKIHGSNESKQVTLCTDCHDIRHHKKPRINHT